MAASLYAQNPNRAPVGGAYYRLINGSVKFYKGGQYAPKGSTFIGPTLPPAPPTPPPPLIPTYPPPTTKPKVNTWKLLTPYITRIIGWKLLPIRNFGGKKYTPPRPISTANHPTNYEARITLRRGLPFQ